MAAIITLNDVHLGYNRMPVLKGIRLSVEEGDVLGILGPNGSGKSTLLKLMTGILQPDKGQVRVRNKPLNRLDRSEIAREIAMVSQESHFRFSFSVTEIVLMGRFPHLGNLQFEGKRDMEVTRDAMRAAQCLELANRSIHELSGGEKQRVLIARALAQEPKLILLDEPTAFLDLKYKREIFQLIDSLTKTKGVSVVVVSHDLDLAAQYCSRIALLKRGAIDRLGTPEQVITSTNIESLFECPVQVDRNPATDKPRVNIM